MKNNKRMKVLYIDLHGDKIYGAENSLYELVTHIGSCNVDPYVICPEVGVFANKLKTQNIPVIIIKMPKLFTPKEELGNIFRFVKVCIKSIKAGFGILRIVKKNKIDIIHVNNSNNVNIVIPKLLSRVIVIWHLRDILNTERLWPRFIKFMISKLSNRIIAISNSVAGPLSQCFKGKIDIIVNAVSSERFNITNINNVSKNREIIIGTVATICPEKGIEELILAFDKVKSSFSNITLKLYGHASSDQYMAKIIQLIKNKRLFKSIFIYDFRDDIENAIKELDIFILASWAEPLGRSAMEAMQCGRAVIASNAGGLPEIIIDGKTGLLFEPRNYNDLANKILMLLNDKEKRNELGNNAALYANEYFSIEKHVESIYAVYQDTI
jgi:glycosyltransferase involved in cell wall biosynthesis